MRSPTPVLFLLAAGLLLISLGLLAGALAGAGGTDDPQRPTVTVITPRGGLPGSSGGTP